MKKILFVLSLTLSFSIAIPQTIINIPGDYPTIQQGIDAAENGYTVLVDTGTYIENINFNGKNITVASHYLMTADPDYISNTIIDGGQPNHPDTGSVVMIVSGEDSTALLSGFTITNGSGLFTDTSEWAQSTGGGILVQNNSSPKLKNLIVSGNIAESSNGAGIACYDGQNVLIEDRKLKPDN
jgi:hypothetical protein